MLVDAENAALLAQSKASFDEILQQEKRSRIADVVSQGISDSEQEGKEGGLRASKLAQLLTSTWNALPASSRPVLSQVSSHFRTCIDCT